MNIEKLIVKLNSIVVFEINNGFFIIIVIFFF